ncbi:MAG: trypsin-like serine protease [Promethearchaeota archaeon]|nr:MAG: trypsin-like serine protease [Candidatus Lokiarchaeota archaeon]
MKSRNKNIKLLSILLFFLITVGLFISFLPFKNENEPNRNIDEKSGKDNVKELKLNEIIGEDDRVKVEDTTIYPYQTICKLYGINSTGVFARGTAFIIDNFQALTAAHCVYNDDEYCFDEYYVVPGAYSTNFQEYPYGIAYVTNIRMEQEWIDHQYKEYDWAYLTLDRSIGAITGWMGIQTAARENDIYSEKLYTAGYPSDLEGGVNMYHTSDKGLYATEKLHYYELDIYKGQSGSPVWRYDSIDDANYVLTVNAYSSETYNFGTRIKSSRFDSILNWIEEDSISPPNDRPDMEVYRIPGTFIDSTGINTNLIIPGSTTFTPWSVIQNRGTAATGTFKVSYYASTDDIIGKNDYYLGQDTVPSINPFETYNSSISITFPFIPKRSYYIGCIIDPDFNVFEFYEGNNDQLFSEVITIKDAIKLLYPSSKDTLIAGTTQSINWISTGPIVNVKITLVKGLSSYTITSSTPNDGIFSWAIPESLDAGVDYKIIIKDVDSSTSDESDYFTILSQMPVINIFSPSKGTEWLAGDTETIVWDPVSSIQKVNIAYLYPGHAPIQIALRIPNQGQYVWDIPNYLESRTDYRIVIVDAYGHTSYGISNPFRIKELSKSIKVVEPRGNVPWEKGGTYSIIWATKGPIRNVKIFLTKAGLGTLTISSSIHNDGSISWTIPRYLELGNDYQIAIADVDDDTIYAYSNNFKIIEDCTPPSQPILKLPINNDKFRDERLYFDWIKPSEDTAEYQFQLDADSSFMMPIIDTTVSISEITVPPGLYDGDFYWRVRARDESHNWGSWSQLWSFTIDTIGPSAPTLLSPSDGSLLNDNSPQFQWHDVSDAINYRIQIDDTSTSFNSITFDSITQSTQINLNSLNEGVYYYHVKAMDDVGNWGSWSASFMFKIDLNPPETVVDLDGILNDDGWYISDVTITLEASDTLSDIDKIEYSYDGVNWNLYLEPILLSENGIHTLYYRSVDIAGNAEEIKTVIIKIDFDLDGDGLTNMEEINLGTDMYNPDSDFDNLNDGDEVNLYGTDPLNSDTDGDSLSDAEEIFVYETNPINYDTDSDGISDGWEIKYNLNPLSPDDALLDNDLDGLENLMEFNLGTNPLHSDTDGDGISDGDEVNLYGTDPLDDSDTFTPEGNNIEITDDNTGITLNFQKVGAEGVSTIKSESQTSDPPSGFSISGLSGVISITTTFDFSGWVEIAIPYDESLVSNEINLKLLHWNEETQRWEDITTKVDTVNNIIYGKTKSFSIFAIMEPNVDSEVNLLPDIFYQDANEEIYVTPDTSFSILEGGSVRIFDTFYYRINNSEWSIYSEPFSILGANGKYIIEFYGLDYQGNAGIQQAREFYLINLELGSYICDEEENRITYFDLIIKNRKSGYKIVATNPGQFFYCIEIKNTWLIQIDNLDLNLNIPEDFILKGSNPISIYLDGMDITHLCTVIGTSISIAQVLPDSVVKIVVHLDYGLKENFYEIMGDIEMKGYIFMPEIIAQGNGLVESTTIQSKLMAHQKKLTAIAGFVTDVNGNPLQNIEVKLVDASGNLIDTKKTDDNGFYYFNDINTEEYSLLIIYNGDYTMIASAIQNYLIQIDFILFS